MTVPLSPEHTDTRTGALPGALGAYPALPMDDQRPQPASRPKKPAPGAKKARHDRWRRTAKVAMVAALVSFLAATGLFLWPLLFGNPKAEATRLQMDRLAEALLHHRDRHGVLPERLGLRSLRSSDDEISPDDGYGRRMEYRVVAGEGKPGFRLRSWGEDGVAGTADDLIWPAGGTW